MTPKKPQEEAHGMRKSQSSSAPMSGPSFVNFQFENTTYQIDPGRRKVYRSFVEVETSRASQIIATFHGVDLKKNY